MLIEYMHIIGKIWVNFENLFIWKTLMNNTNPKRKMKSHNFFKSIIKQVTRKEDNKDIASTSNLWRKEEYDYGIGYSEGSQLKQI